METIPKADCEKVGFIKKTHGVFGEIVLEFEPHFEASIENADRFLLNLMDCLCHFFFGRWFPF
ncbi:MAG: hypothetical protein IPF54_17605 [Draconibacterium sp.]|nr:hypothetical protein [Draconibacterium sp.]